MFDSEGNKPRSQYDANYQKSRSCNSQATSASRQTDTLGKALEPRFIVSNAVIAPTEVVRRTGEDSGSSDTDGAY